MICFGNVPAGSVLPIPFASYGKTNGESITLTGLAVGDVLIYKGTSMTQRSSTNGVVLLDTDGIDLDLTTGIHGCSIDTGDNSDAGFFVAGSFYYVIVASVTVDSQTVNFIAATFRIVAAENTAGTPVTDAGRIGGTAQTAWPDVGAVQAEPGQAAPAASLTVFSKIAYLFKNWRNLKENDGTTEKLYNDAGTVVDQKRAVSEAAGTVAKGKVGTGP